MRGRVRATETKREKKIVKILNAHATVTMHICTITVAIVHLCTTLHPLILVFFCSKCVKSVTLSILQNFTHTDVDALRCSK